jgi:hypothetical protein
MSNDKRIALDRWGKCEEAARKLLEATRKLLEAMRRKLSGGQLLTIKLCAN